jgi:hypothetical protein
VIERRIPDARIRRRQGSASPVNAAPVNAAPETAPLNSQSPPQSLGSH